MVHKILIIDDDEGIHKSIKSILSYHQMELEYMASTMGFENIDEPELNDDLIIDDAYQGIEGVNKVRKSLIQQSPYLVIFIDVRMPPGWNGVKTAQEIRKIDKLTQIVFITAFLDQNREAIINKVGEADKLIFLQKPFYNSEIDALVTNLSSMGTVLEI